jgi:hypothetical protein
MESSQTNVTDLKKELKREKSMNHENQTAVLLLS